MKYYNNRNNVQRREKVQQRRRLCTFGTFGIIAKTALILIPVDRTHAWTNTIHSAVVSSHRYHGAATAVVSSQSKFSTSTIFMSNKDSFWGDHIGGDAAEGFSPSNLLLSLKNNDFKGTGINAGDSYSALEKAVLSSSSPSSSSNESSGTANVGDVRSILETWTAQLTETIHVIQDLQHTAYLTVIGNTLQVLKNLDGLSSFLFSTFVALPLVTAQQYASQLSSVVQEFLSSTDAALLQDPTVGPILLSLQTKVQQLSMVLLGPQQELVIPPTVGILSSAFATYVILSTVLSMGKGPPPSSPYPLGRYDPNSARAYFDQRPLSMLQRGLEIASLSVGFGLKLLQDKMKNQLDDNQDQRALELAELLTKLGPTFSKFVQSFVNVCV